jgi:hypothetical protein
LVDVAEGILDYLAFMFHGYLAHQQRIKNLECSYGYMQGVSYAQDMCKTYFGRKKAA